jgi:hypothetical protein
MKKIKQLSLVLFIFSVLALSYPVTQVFAQGGGQCDSNPACDPASGTCCNQCDPNPACVAGDPHAIPCCSSGSNNMSSGTLPPRIPAPSGHNKMNHENRRPSDNSDLPEGEELRDAFKGCLEKLEMHKKREPNRAISNPAPRPQQNCAPINTQAESSLGQQIQTLRMENREKSRKLNAICAHAPNTLTVPSYAGHWERAAKNILIIECLGNSQGLLN